MISFVADRDRRLAVPETRAQGVRCQNFGRPPPEISTGLKNFQGGFVGVDVFFVISGYLITSIILTELRQEKFSIFKFYERRPRRIRSALMSYLVVLETGVLSSARRSVRRT